MRTFRSGPYLEGLFGPTAVDAYLEQEICARIKQARKEAGFTQEDMAGLLDVTLRAYQNYERNRVPFRRLEDIERLTGRSQEWLLRGDEQAETAVVEQLQALAAGQVALESSLEDALRLLRRLVQVQDETGRA